MDLPLHLWQHKGQQKLAYYSSRKWCKAAIGQFEDDLSLGSGVMLWREATTPCLAAAADSC